MFKYIVKRILTSIVILLGVSLILYTLLRMMPASFIDSKIAAINQGGATVPQSVVDNMKKMYNLDGNVIQGYFKWLSALARFDLGECFIGGQKVFDKIVENMGVSFMVAAIATVFEFLIAIPLGITAATHQYSIRDYVVTVLVMIGISLPSFFLARLLQYSFSIKITEWAGQEILPVQGYGDPKVTLYGFEKVADYLRYIILPVITVVILSIGSRMRMTRTNMLEVLNSDYIRTARAKGLSEGKVIYKHAFRNTLIPIVTDLAGLLPALFSGAMITETIFKLPGIGSIALDAMTRVDIPFIMGYNMFLAFLSVVGVLLADLMYAVVDPRVKLA